MKKIVLLSLSLVFGCTFLAQATTLPAEADTAKSSAPEMFTMVDIVAKVRNVDKNGKITRGKTELIKKIIPHAKPGEPVDKEKILALSTIARKEMKETEDNTATLSIFGDIANQVSDFINAAKGGVGNLAGSAAGFVSGTAVDAVVGAIAGVLIP